MKKTFILTALLGMALSVGVARADDIKELMYGLDFNQIEGAGYSLTNLADNGVANDLSLTAIESTATTGYRNYGSLEQNGGNGTLSGRMSGNTFKIGNQTTAIAGISGSEGFTLNFSYNMGQEWQNAIGFIYGGKKFSAQYGSSSFHVFSEGSTLTPGVGVSGVANPDNLTWYNVSLVIKGDSLTMIHVAEDGTTKTSTTTLQGVDSSLGLTYVAGYGEGITNGLNAAGNDQSFDRPASSPYSYLDDFSIWNGALTQGDAVELANNSFSGVAMAQYIPEPSSASLSLLALAGLMIRRRRK